MVMYCTGTGSDSNYCYEVEKVRCTLYSWQPFQYGQVSSICNSNNVSQLLPFLSFSFLWGPLAHLMHLLSCERLPFTLGYLATAIGTLYCALSVSTPSIRIVQYSTLNVHVAQCHSIFFSPDILSRHLDNLSWDMDNLS